MIEKQTDREPTRYEIPDALSAMVRLVEADAAQIREIDAKLQTHLQTLYELTVAAGVDVPKGVQYRDGAFWPPS